MGNPIEQKGIYISADGLDRYQREMAVGKKALSVLKQSLPDSVVCIRNHGIFKKQVAPLLQLYKYHETKVTDAKFEEILERRQTTGTGVVIGEEEIEGNKEYLILTNNHVVRAGNYNRLMIEAEPGKYVVDALLEHHELALIEDGYDNTKGKMGLEVIATAVDHDAALVRTVGAQEKLSVFPHSLGMPDDEITLEKPAVTSGFPLGLNKIVTGGKLITKDAIDFMLTPVPNKHYLADISIDPGQSGSPVVMPRFVTANGGIYVDFGLIGLVYGKAENYDTIRMITPYNQFEQMVVKKESIPTKSASLLADIGIKDLEWLLEETGDLFSRADVGDFTFMLDKKNGSYELNQYRLSGPAIIPHDHISWRFNVDDGVNAQNIHYISDDQPSGKLDLAGDEQLAKKTERYITACLNQLGLYAEHAKMNGGDHESDASRELIYITSIINTNTEYLENESAILRTDLYRRGMIPHYFAV
ncbi:trypsin-like peptidase domain-containing protein [Candidatus Woesearchaeota archaeon]|nr:trypsin-like peptidase domain-containing protein [Candidatus Woesearchaeota archaeon]